MNKLGYRRVIIFEMISRMSAKHDVTMAAYHLRNAHNIWLAGSFIHDQIWIIHLELVNFKINNG